MLWRGAHQHGDAPGRTCARATATSKLTTGQLTRVWKQGREKEDRVVIKKEFDEGPYRHSGNVRVRHRTKARE